MQTKLQTKLYIKKVNDFDTAWKFGGSADISGRWFMISNGLIREWINGEWVNTWKLAGFRLPAFDKSASTARAIRAKLRDQFPQG